MSGPLFLHGFGASGRGWDAVRAELPEAMRGAAPDLPGFGGAPDLPHPSLDGYVDHLLDTQGDPSGRWVVAHSMGGKLAFLLAVRPGVRLAGLVLVAPTTPGPEPMTEDQRRALVEGRDDPDRARAGLHAELTREIPIAAFDATLADRLATSRDAARWWALEGSRQDVRHRLGRLDPPPVVLVGARDHRLGEAAQRRELLPHLADATLAVEADAGHLVPLEAPGAVAGAIRGVFA